MQNRIIFLVKFDYIRNLKKKFLNKNNIIKIVAFKFKFKYT